MFASLGCGGRPLSCWRGRESTRAGDAARMAALVLLVAGEGRGVSPFEAVGGSAWLSGRWR